MTVFPGKYFFSIVVIFLLEKYFFKLFCPKNGFLAQENFFWRPFRFFFSQKIICFGRKIVSLCFNFLNFLNQKKPSHHIFLWKEETIWLHISQEIVKDFQVSLILEEKSLKKRWHFCNFIIYKHNFQKLNVVSD